MPLHAQPFQPLILESVHENKAKMISNTPLMVRLCLNVAAVCYCTCLLSSGAQQLYLMIAKRHKYTMSVMVGYVFRL